MDRKLTKIMFRKQETHFGPLQNYSCYILTRFVPIPSEAHSLKPGTSNKPNNSGSTFPNCNLATSQGPVVTSFPYHASILIKQTQHITMSKMSTVNLTLHLTLALTYKSVINVKTLWVIHILKHRAYVWTD